MIQEDGMRSECKLIGALFALLANVVLVVPAHAASEAYTDWGKVLALQVGWMVDRVLVFHGAEMKNPEGCTLTTNGYIIDESTPGRGTFYTFLLSGLLNTRDVQLVIQGCFENRPRIVSVSIK
jgi:hypothetical protein